MNIASLKLNCSGPITGPKWAQPRPYRSNHTNVVSLVPRASASSLTVDATESPSRIESLSQVSGVLGCQWGDEGKGKLVDILAEHFDIVARCQVLLFLSD